MSITCLNGKKPTFSPSNSIFPLKLNRICSIDILLDASVSSKTILEFYMNETGRIVCRKKRTFFFYDFKKPINCFYFAKCLIKLLLRNRTLVQGSILFLSTSSTLYVYCNILPQNELDYSSLMGNKSMRIVACSL